MEMVAGIFFSGLMFIVGNFIYQPFLRNPNWKLAIERSFFQGIMLMFILFQVWRNIDV